MDVTLRNIALRYPGSERPAVEGFDLDIHDGEFLVLVGPSGCGKSTTLRMLAGLELPTAGRIRFGERDVTAMPASERDIAMVFQSYALYPHMTVAANMEFALRNSGVPKAERARRVQEAAQLLDIDQFLNRKPRALSGGQRQRVAMGRAIVRSPEVFLMDEPLSNLDAKLRVQTRTQISALQRRLGVTTVYVTHDQTEAMTMGDRVVVMNGGRIEQVGTPRELYDRPQTLFVAGFIGSPMMNLLTARVEPDGGSGTQARVGGLTVPLPRDMPVVGDELVLGVRPEDLRPAAFAADVVSGLELEVQLTEALGSDTYVYGRRTDDPSTPQVVARVGKHDDPHPGDRIAFTVAPRALLVFDPQDGRALATGVSASV